MSLRSCGRLRSLGAGISANPTLAGRGHTKSCCTCPGMIPADPTAVQVLAGNAGAASSAAASAQANAQAVSSTAVARSGNCTDAASRAASYAATASAFAAAASAAGASSACQTGGANRQVPSVPMALIQQLSTPLHAAQFGNSGGHICACKAMSLMFRACQPLKPDLLSMHAIQACCAVLACECRGKEQGGGGLNCRLCRPLRIQCKCRSKRCGRECCSHSCLFRRRGRLLCGCETPSSA